jgi:hypothetical protein
LVLRDLDVIRKATEFEVGFTVTTADDDVRRKIEPRAPLLATGSGHWISSTGLGQDIRYDRHDSSGSTEALPELLAGKVDFPLVGKLNYHYVDWVHRKCGLEDRRTTISSGGWDENSQRGYGN